jgi:hypothetical protein
MGDDSKAAADCSLNLRVTRVYPDIDMQGNLAPDGRYRFTRKNGTSLE